MWRPCSEPPTYGRFELHQTIKEQDYKYVNIWPAPFDVELLFLFIQNVLKSTVTAQ